MARAREAQVQQSILDRLSERQEWPTTHTASLRLLKESIRRELEDLLNTRRPLARELENYEAARSSVLNYGLDDQSGIKPLSQGNLQELQQAVSRCIAEYEPRLRDVTVSAGSDNNSLCRDIRFHIEATLPVHPSTEIISFDTMLDLASGMYSIG